MKQKITRLGLIGIMSSAALLTTGTFSSPLAWADTANLLPSQATGEVLSDPTEPEPGAYTGHSFTVDLNARAAVAGVPPAPCVSAALDPPGIVTQTVHVRNGCPNQQRVQVLARLQPDSPCFIIDPKGQVDYAMDRSSVNNNPFDGLQAC